MRKSVLFALLCSLLFYGCSKDKSVTVEHSVSADFEPTEAMATLPVIWVDATTGEIDGAELNSLMASSSAKVGLLTLPSSFEGDAFSWIEANSGSWPFNGNSISMTVDGKTYFVSSDEAEPTFFPIGTKGVLEITKGKFSLILGSIAESDTEILLEKTWFATSERDWMYFLSLPAASVTLTNASFLDCLREMFGTTVPDDLGSWLYTGPGTWNCMAGIKMSVSPVLTVSFTIKAEESRL